jgi:hypothetical protein
MKSEFVVNSRAELEREFGGSYARLKQWPWFELLEYPEAAMVLALGEIRMQLKHLPDPELVLKLVKKHANKLEG